MDQRSRKREATILEPANTEDAPADQRAILWAMQFSFIRWHGQTIDSSDASVIALLPEGITEHRERLMQEVRKTFPAR